ncbi:MAG TPA: ACT domain-containing protein [Candidatus Deferrimicrobiaceae bacterium]|nr:ACT domain-containing protein [Candidatus Deferrimicrobiaceae bacterium]
MILFMIDLKDQPGELARLSDAIARKGINIESVTGVASRGGGTVAVITNDEAGTRSALSEAGYQARETEIATASLEHKPGTLAAAAKKLADAGINIIAALPIGMAEGKVGVAFATDQPAKAKEILGGGSKVGVSVG